MASESAGVTALRRVGVLALFLVVLWLVPHLPASFCRLLQDLTGGLIVRLSGLLGLSAYYNPDSHHFAVAGFAMRLVDECLALHYHAILTLAVLLIPAQGWRRRGVALLACNAMLLFFNILRLVFLGIVGAYAPGLFAVVHDYVWQVAFAVLTLVLSFAWTEPGNQRQRPPSVVLLYGLGFAALLTAGLDAVKYPYLNGLTWLADKAVLLTGLDLPLSERWWVVTAKSHVMIRLAGEKVAFVLPTERVTVSLWPDILGLALFLGFCAGSACYLRGRGEFPPLLPLAVRIGGGSLLLLLCHAATVAGLGWLLLTNAQQETGLNFLWLMRGLSVLLPVILWWLIWSSSRSEAPSVATA